jgi:hypothetical protein
MWLAASDMVLLVSPNRIHSGKIARWQAALNCYIVAILRARTESITIVVCCPSLITKVFCHIAWIQFWR